VKNLAKSLTCLPPVLSVILTVSLWCTDIGGLILYGIQSQFPVSGCATIRGLCCNQEKRDLFRVRFTKLITERIQPPLAAGTVTVHFWPVIDRHSRQPIDDLFVVGMQLLLCKCLI